MDVGETLAAKKTNPLIANFVAVSNVGTFRSLTDCVEGLRVKKLQLRSPTVLRASRKALVSH